MTLYLLTSAWRLGNISPSILSFRENRMQYAHTLNQYLILNLVRDIYISNIRKVLKMKISYDISCHIGYLTYKVLFKICKFIAPTPTD